MGKDNMKETNNFGLTEQEENMNLHDYNHALFQNMMFFMDIVWEINMLMGTVVILHDRNEPDKGSTELSYREAFRDYVENRIGETEKPVFEQYMAPDNLKKLEKEVSFDIHLHQRNGGRDLHRIVLTPAFDQYGKLYCVYLGARNLQSETSREPAADYSRNQAEIRQQEALQEAYETANRANSAKTEFLTQISHDIRTPLNAIIGMTAIAEKHQENKERVTECLRKISISGKYLLSLVDGMLDMSMIESGKMELHEEEIDLAELFDNLSIILGMQIKDKGHEFSSEVLRMEHEKVLSDRRRIDQIIMNLVDNAAKYTMEEGKISMTLEEKPTNQQGIGCYEIVVEDNGIGMEPEFVERLFKPFVRAKDRRVEKIQGSGLGLAITNNIVRMMNGGIYVKSEPEKGTKVTVKIFLKLSEAKGLKTITGDESEEDQKSPIQALSERDFSGHRVLMVDDNESNADIIREILEMVGLEVEQAWNGQEAIEMISAAEDWYYNIVFMDIQMPVMDGCEAVKAIRRLDRSYAKEVPILAMSANAFAEDIQASLAAGMNEHISKPIDLKKLEEALCRWLPEKVSER